MLFAVGSGLLPKSLDTAARILLEADAVIISAGAGLSASAGLDCLSTYPFAENFPGMRTHSLRTMYDFIGFEDWIDDGGRLMLEYLLSQAALEASWPPSRVYALAREIVEKEGRPFFVFTSNTDGLFSLNGYPEDKVCQAQGMLSRVQCAVPCREDAVWPVSEFAAALADVDPETNAIRDLALVPRCRYCNGPCTSNINDGDAWLGGAHLPSRAAFASFVREQRTQGAKLAILELGMGFNSPAVARLPMETLCAAWGQKGWRGWLGSIRKGGKFRGGWRRLGVWGSGRMRERCWRRCIRGCLARMAQRRLGLRGLDSVDVSVGAIEEQIWVRDRVEEEQWEMEQPQD